MTNKEKYKQAFSVLHTSENFSPEVEIMAKLNKIYYYTSQKEKKLNCYYITIKKEDKEKAHLNDEVDIIVENNKIIIKNVDKD